MSYNETKLKGKKPNLTTQLKGGRKVERGGKKKQFIRLALLGMAIPSRAKEEGV